MRTASDAMETKQYRPPAVEAPVRRPRRRRRILLTLAFLLVAAGVAATLWVIRNDANETPPPVAAPATSATVERQTLEQHTEVNGKLGYAGYFEVVNRAEGVLTNLPAVGRVVRAGEVLYRVDGKPIILLRGDRTPAYRTLSKGVRGADVRQLNAALVARGYDSGYGPKKSSSRYDWTTVAAVKRLQDDLNTTETGRLELGQVVFLPTERIRVTEVDGSYGATASPGQSLVKATSTTPRVSIAMDASQAADVKAGDKVTVSLPNGEDVPSRVTSVGRVATTTEDGSTVPVEVRLSEQTGLDAASVKVTITSASQKDALAVPVTALLAMSGGGYSVEILNADDTRRLVRVKIGMFDGAAGRVAVTGPGLTEGQRVVVPAT